ncbi:hypothetical protein Ciccas_007165 [Cichlidogyrus casuarinus]|uniref:Uncharacterized protein n=1 Tax=Cichlidogyrus casuarinus TaxID=1844966 RepID=A0ABD2Q4Z4_9PLAT
MPRSTRSSTRAVKPEESTTSPKTPKKQNHLAKTVVADSPRLPKSVGRPSRKNPAPSPSPRSSKRLRRADEHSASDEEPVIKSSNRRASARNCNSPAVVAQTPTRRSKRPMQDSPDQDTPSPKKKTPKPVSSKRNRKSTNDLKNLSDEETVEKRPRIETPKVILKPPLPRKLSRVELYDEALKNLASRLDMFDLTDPADATNIWCDWPTQDGSPSFKDLQALLLNRIWFSASGPDSTPSTVSSYFPLERNRIK